VYDMYPWDARADGPRTPAPRNGDDSAPDLATAAVQFALDRRDNGGDAATAKTSADAGPDTSPASAASGRQ
jgi:hypothetical protein